MVVFAVFFTLGVWWLQQQPVLPDFVWAWLLPGLLPALLIPRRTRFHRIARTVLIALLGCGLGFYLAAWRADQRLSSTLPDEWQGRDIAVVGVVAEPPRSHERGLRFQFDVEQVLTRVPGQEFFVPQASVPDHVYLSTYSDAKARPLAPKAGERWRFTLRLKQPHGTANPGGFDFEAWMLERDLRAVGYVHPKGDNARLDELAEGFGYRIERWRESVRDKFSATLGSAPYAGILSALAIGDQDNIPPQQWQVFTRTGVNHLMSISGLHITMLASLAFAVAYWLWRRSTRLTLWLPARKAAALAALLTAIGYALLAGFAVPAQRTVYMVAAVTAALWLNRNFSLGQILAIALLGVLIPDPWAVISAGFWLSFGAVALILFVTAHRIGRPSWLKEYAAVQWAMTIGLTPLLLALFQQVSLVSPIANALAIPLVSLIVVPLALLGAALPTEVPLWLAHIAMDGTMRFLEWLSALPQAVWTQHAPPLWSIFAAVLGALWLLLPRGFPARWLGVLMMLPIFLNAPEPPAENTLRLIVFDVGQGLAVAAQTRNHALLYDAGPDFSGEADSGNRILVPTLRALGVERLDGMMLSHDDIDHIGGAASVLQSMSIDWLSSSLPDEHPLRRLLPLSPNPSDGTTSQSTKSASGQVAGYPVNGRGETKRCADGQGWEWDGVRFDVLHPSAEQRVYGKKQDNELSCVLRISIGDQHILLVGDIEKDGERRMLKQHGNELHTTLLVAPHHGSKTSSSPDFVAATLPDHVVFTAGYRNRFGHPRAEVLQRYADSGAQLLRSDADGAILVEMGARGLKLERYRETHRRYWTHRPRQE